MVAGLSVSSDRESINQLTVSSPVFKQYYRDVCQDLKLEMSSEIAHAMLKDYKVRLRQRLNYLTKNTAEKKNKAKARSKAKRLERSALRRQAKSDGLVDESEREFDQSNVAAEQSNDDKAGSADRKRNALKPARKRVAPQSESEDGSVRDSESQDKPAPAGNAHRAVPKGDATLIKLNCPVIRLIVFNNM
jgi:hypothetical protein